MARRRKADALAVETAIENNDTENRIEDTLNIAQTETTPPTLESSTGEIAGKAAVEPRQRRTTTRRKAPEIKTDETTPVAITAADGTTTGESVTTEESVTTGEAIPDSGVATNDQKGNRASEATPETAQQDSRSGESLARSRRTRSKKSPQAAITTDPTREEATALLEGLTRGLTAPVGASLVGVTLVGASLPDAVEAQEAPVDTVIGDELSSEIASSIVSSSVVASSEEDYSQYLSDPDSPRSVITVTIDAPVESVDISAEATEAAPEKTGRSRRRGRGKPQTDSARNGDVSDTSQTLATSGGITDAPNGTTTAESGTKRVRGLRKVRATGPTIIVAPTLAEIAPAPVIEAGSETSETSIEKPKRIRGLRNVTRPVPVVIAPPIVVAEPGPEIYKPLPAEVLANLAETRIVVQNGVPELLVNGEPRFPVWCFVNTEDAEARTIAIRQVRLAYEAGVRFFSVLAHLPWKTRSGERRFEPLDEALQIIAENAPEALILPRLLFSPLNSWIRANEDQMTLFSDDEKGDVSLASRVFWEEEADSALRAAVERVAQGPYAEKVFGFYLEHGEWFYEKGRGFDRSPANIEGFRSWLKTQYRNSVVALRSAWFDGSVTFETALIPDWPTPEGPYLFFSARERRYADYYQYASDQITHIIARLGKAIKEASGERSAVAVSYGYSLELMRPDSGHLSLGNLLESPYIDILTGPISYSGRLPGGSAPLPAPVDSVHLAGKLWVFEDDAKTHLALEGEDETPDTYNPKIDTVEGVLAAHARNFGAALVRGAGMSFMDLWGQGWLADPAIWQNIGRLRSIGERLAQLRRSAGKAAAEPDVAVFVDERSFFGVRHEDNLLDELIAQHRDTLLRSGARIGFYLLSDLLKPNFPKSPRIFLFLNAFRLPDSIRAVLKARWQNDGRTLAWIYGPGALEESVTEVADAIGMTLQLQSWGSKAGTQISSSARSPLTDALRGQKIGDEVRLNPTYYVVDPKAQPLGEYVHSGCISLAVRKHPRWQSVFIGERTMPLSLLRGLYRLAGVPTYTVDDDTAAIGDNSLILHSAPGGGTTVYLPEAGALGDALTGESFASDGFGARLSMPVRGTRFLIHGKKEMLADFGIDVSKAPPGLTESELPPSSSPFNFEESDDVPFSNATAATSEDAELFEAALAGELPIVDKDTGEEQSEKVAEGITAADAAAAESAARKKRRRRRRRGRGKGVLETGGEEGSGSNESEEDSDEESDDTEGDEETVEATINEIPEEIPVVVIIPEVTPVRVRPSLEELLPFSDTLLESPDGESSLPIPEEFLPLASDALLSGTGGAAKLVRRRRRQTPAGRVAEAIEVIEATAETSGDAGTIASEETVSSPTDAQPFPDDPHE